MRILILTAPFGAGHRLAGQALYDFCVQQGYAKCEIMDCYSLLPNNLSDVLVKTYLLSLKIDRRIYQWLYRNSNARKSNLFWRAMINRLFAGLLKKNICRYKPDAVICTHATPLGAVVELQRKKIYPGRIYSVITDFTVHNWLIYRDYVTYFVACQENATVLCEASVKNTIISGIPLRQQFYNMVRIKNYENDYDGQLHVLISGGGEGLMPIAEITQKLMQLSEKIKIIAVCGRAEKLKLKLEKMFASYTQVTILGYVDNMADLLRSVDLLISKSGGLSCSEALEAAVPTMVYAPLPGQEMANAAWLSAKDLAWQAKDKEELLELVLDIMKNPKKLENMHRRLQIQPTNRAVKVILDYVVKGTTLF